MLSIKRVYESATPEDGYRVLIDGLWPRGLSRDKANIDEWKKEIAPSPELRKWFGHLPDRWPEFNERYRQELHSPIRASCLQALRDLAAQRNTTLLFAARDIERCNAAVLLAVLTEE